MPDVVVSDPQPNKAIVAALGTIVTVLGQLATSGWNFDLEGEGISALGGALVTLLVYAVSNRKKLLS